MNNQLLQQEAKKLIDESMDNFVINACWNCNCKQEYLKKSKQVIYCFGCGNYYYGGENIASD